MAYWFLPHAAAFRLHGPMMIMDHVMIEAKRLGGELVCPMFDGALFSFSTGAESIVGDNLALAAK